MNVYILSLYGEDGAEEVTATLDKSKLAALLDSYRTRYPHRDLVTERAALMMLLAEDVASEGGHNLARGWGGWMLHIVELDKPIAPLAPDAGPA